MSGLNKRGSVAKWMSNLSGLTQDVRIVPVAEVI